MTITLHRRGPGGYRVLIDHDLVGWVRPVRNNGTGSIGSGRTSGAR
jgi:hypothetical protein